MLIYNVIDVKHNWRIKALHSQAKGCLDPSQIQAMQNIASQDCRLPVGLTPPSFLNMPIH